VRADDTAAVVNSLDETYSFTITDSSPPTISNELPARLATAVAKNTTIAFRVSDNGGVDATTLVITVNGNTAYNGGLGFQTGYDGGLSAVTPAPGANPGELFYDVVIDPTSDFGDKETVTVGIQVSDVPVVTQNQLIDSYTFETVDSGAPFLTALDPASSETGVAENSTIALTIDDAGSGVDYATVVVRVKVDSGANVVAFEGASGGHKAAFNGPRASLSSTSTSLIIVLDPITPFPKAAVISIEVDASDVDGNSL
jgi:hypothetical protein